MQLVASFVGGFLVSLVVFFQFSNESKLQLNSYQEKLNACTQQLTLSETKINGMLMNK